MKDRIVKILSSDRFVILLGLVGVPLISFVFITVSEESPLYTSISRIAWVHGRWFSTFTWALIVMGSVMLLTYRMVAAGPLSHRTKKIFLLCQSINIIFVFVGCIVFPAKAGVETVKLVNYIHDYLTIGAWTLYGTGLFLYSILIKAKDYYLGFLGLGLMSFIIFSCRQKNVNILLTNIVIFWFNFKCRNYSFQRFLNFFTFF